MKLGSREAVLEVLSDGIPKSRRELVEMTGFSDKAVGNVLRRMWKEGLLVRTEKPSRQHIKTFKGRGGIRLNMRNFHLYMLRSEDTDRFTYQARLFVGFDEEYLDVRGGKGKSKASMILDFIGENGETAFYTTDVVEAALLGAYTE